MRTTFRVPFHDTGCCKGTIRLSTRVATRVSQGHFQGRIRVTMGVTLRASIRGTTMVDLTLTLNPKPSTLDTETLQPRGTARPMPTTGASWKNRGGGPTKP